MATIREILQKSFPTCFNRQACRKKHYVTMANSTRMSSVRDGHHSRNFAKIISNFFLSAKHGEKALCHDGKVYLNVQHNVQSERKRSVMMANSRWPPFAKFCKNEFRLFFKP